MRTLLTTATSHDIANLQPKIAVLPIGSFEQHGGILPLATDTVVAQLIAERIASDYDLFLLPPVTISCSHEHAGFAGTVSISAQTLIALIADIRASLSATGVEKLVLVNGHGGNYVLSNIAQEANTTGVSVALYPGRVEWQAARDAAGLETSISEDMHAGELEVSLVLHAAPELVNASRATADHLATDRPHLLMTGLAELTTTGIIGRPSLGTAEKGALILTSLSASFASFHKLLGE